ncbi:MAG: hypothetical protein MMC23_001107 [Stictis urceolatum]|nr:hypothetical protein [Stictis urceolata]
MRNPIGSAIQWATLDIGCLSPKEQQRLIESKYDLNDPPGRVDLNSTYSDFVGTVKSKPVQPCVYYITGLLRSDARNASSPAYLLGKDLTKPVTLSILNYLYKNGNATFESINSTMSSVANSMTTRIRSTSSGPEDANLPAIGAVFRTELCIYVQWAWISLPIVLAIITIVFFVAMLYATGRKWGKHYWKASLTALLLHGLNDATRDQHGSLNYQGEMKNFAESSMVQLIDEDKPWRFVKT